MRKFPSSVNPAIAPCAAFAPDAPAPPQHAHPPTRCHHAPAEFAGFIVLIVGAYCSSIYGFITGAFVDGVTAGATYHQSTEQATIQDRAAVMAVTMAGGSEDYEDLDEGSWVIPTYARGYYAGLG